MYRSDILNIDAVIPSRAGRSNSWLSTFTACARVKERLDELSFYYSPS